MKNDRLKRIIAVAITILLLPLPCAAAASYDGKAPEILIPYIEQFAYDSESMTIMLDASKIVADIKTPGDTTILSIGQKLTIAYSGGLELTSFYDIAWKADGVVIAGATGTHWIVNADPGSVITVELHSKTGSGIIRYLVGTVKVAMTGSAFITRTSNTLVATILSFSGTVDDYTTTWYRDGIEYKTAAGESYDLSAVDYGKKFKVIYTANAESGYIGSIVSSEFTVPAIAPGAPNITVTAGDTQVAVNLAAAENGSPVLRYNVKIYDNSGYSKEVTLTTETSYTFTGLTNGKAYYITATATNAIGTSSEATIVSSPTSSGSPGGGGSGGGTSTRTIDYSVATTTGEATVLKADLKTAKTLSVEAKLDPDRKVSVEFDSKALSMIGTSKDLKLTVEEKKSGNFVIDQGNALTAFDISAYVGGQPITNFGSGTLTIVLPYTPAAGEDIGNISVYHIDDLGNATRISAVYDASKGGFVFTVNHLSVFALVLEKSASRFIDVDPNGWSAEYINYLVDQGILGGVGNNRFEPQRSITRAEFVKIMALAANADLSIYKDSSFSDVDNGDWYAPYAEWAYQNGISNGTSAGNFSPDQMISRQEMATMIYRYIQYIGYTLPDTAAPIVFADADSIAEYAKDAVNVLQRAGIVGGITGADSYVRFMPNAFTTREQTAKMVAVLHRLLLQQTK